MLRWLIDRRAKKGAQIMDTFAPDWFKKIDRDRLNMDSCEDCIFGQVIGRYDLYGARLLHVHPFSNRGIFRGIRTGFMPGLSYFLTAGHWGHKPLAQAWKRQIEMRLAAAQPA